MSHNKVEIPEPHNSTAHTNNTNNSPAIGGSGGARLTDAGLTGPNRSPRESMEDVAPMSSPSVGRTELLHSGVHQPTRGGSLGLHSGRFMMNRRVPALSFGGSDDVEASPSIGIRSHTMMNADESLAWRQSQALHPSKPRRRFWPFLRC